MSRLVFAFMYLIHFLPLPVLEKVGNALGAIMFWLIPERRMVTRVNLRKCFPDMDAQAREKLAAAQEQQDYDTGCLYAGQGVGLVTEERPATTVVAGLAAGAESLLRRWG